VVEHLDGDFDLIFDGVCGHTFGLAIERVARRGSSSTSTHSDDETVTFHARRFDRARGARIYTVNLFDELASHSRWEQRPHAPLRADERWTARRPGRTGALMVRPLAGLDALLGARGSAARPCSTSTDRRAAEGQIASE
jgi:hypothetical protein